MLLADCCSLRREADAPNNHTAPSERNTHMLAVLQVLLAIGTVFILLGALLPGLLWLLIVGVVLVLATGSIRFVKREAPGRRR